MFNIERLVPVNRHLLIVPHFNEKAEETGVLLPGDYEQEDKKYIRATVIDVASDCKKHFYSLRYGTVKNQKEILIDKHMIEEIETKDRKHYIILENYVAGIFRSPDED